MKILAYVLGLLALAALLMLLAGCHKRSRSTQQCEITNVSDVLVFGDQVGARSILTNASNIVWIGNQDSLTNLNKSK